MSKSVAPLIPLRGIVVFPNMVVPLIIGRESSIKAVTSAFSNKTSLFLSTQRVKEKENPEKEDLFQVGCVAHILEVINLPNGMIRVLIEGESRAEMLNYNKLEDHVQVEYGLLPDEISNQDEIDILMKNLKEKFTEFVRLNPKIPQEISGSISLLEDPSKLVDAVMANVISQVEDKQSVLEENDLNARMTQTLVLIQSELQDLELEESIKKRVQDRMENMQKRYYLNEQIKEIRKELNEKDDGDDTIVELRKKAENKHMPDEVAEKFEKELDRLGKIPGMSPEYTVLYNYIETLADLPWGILTEDNKDLEEAETILEKEHYGLKEAKERILDFIAIRQINPTSKGPIICLVGPPGTGKTSLARSVAHALNRKFVRFSLGGVRDEAEIRGHRRTYVGSMTGKILQMLKKASSINPVFLLDEIDKMNADFRGDPSSALLEVLDPEQNKTFNDNYLAMDFDLSYVFFITTANNLYNIPGPLRDRMEIIQIPGYTELEKKEIFKRFLLPKQIKENGVEGIDIKFTDEAVFNLIRYYTREAGVRNLERNIGKIVRKVVRKSLKTKTNSVKITPATLRKYLGIEKFSYTSTQKEPRIGVISGLAWTEAGGDVLQIESSLFKGKGNLILTGKLGEVMQESAKIAYSLAKTISEKYGVDPKIYYENDLHIHVPEGAIPKDGPSAGVTMISSIVSTVTRRYARNDIAMTGEITLKGDVLPIGGLREKLLAAKRGGVRQVLIPAKNEKDIKEMEKQITKGLEITFVSRVDDVLSVILISEEK